MANGIGTATLDFGADPGSNEAFVVVTGQTSIQASSKVEAWVMGDDTTATHTASDHKYFPVFASITCGTPTGGTGFTIYARSIHKLTNSFQVRWVWAD